MLTFGDFVRRNGQTWPDKSAFVELNRRMTWGVFHHRTDALGHALRDFGVTVGDRVAVLTHDCIETAEIFTACAKIGATRVGLNARLAPPELAALVKDCRPCVIFVHADCQALMIQIAGNGREDCLFVGFGGNHDYDNDYEDMQSRAGARGALAQTPAEILMIAYTTGSTGLPKGAIYRHDSFLTSLLYTALYEGAMSDTVWLHTMPAAGIPLMHMLRNMFHASTTVIVGPWEPERALMLIERERTTHMVVVPTMLNALLSSDSLGKYDLGSMRLLGYGASPLPAATIREAMGAFGCPFLQMYGTTELTGMSMMLMPADHARGLSSQPELLLSAGKPLSFVDVKIVDEDLREVPRGEMGELMVYSPLTIRGYWEAPDQYAETFRDGWLRTGDMARQDPAGYVYLGDRLKFRIKTGGYNVFPTEVENVLASHPAINEVAVVGLPDSVWGERIHAVVSLKPLGNVTLEELREFCRSRIAGYKTPKSLDIWPEIPKGSTGKIQKRAIIEACSEKPTADPRPLTGN